MKAIFLDIDGTLVTPGSNIPPESAVKAVKLAQQAGHKVFLCTGRNFGMIGQLLQYGFDGVVSSSGGYITCGEETIFDCPMSPEQTKRVMDVLAENGVYRTIECRDCSYTDESFKDFLREKAEKNSNSELLRWRVQLEKDLGIKPMTEWHGQPVYKLVVMCDDRAQLDEPIAKLSDEFAFVIQDGPFANSYINGEIANRAFNKGTAVKQVCAHLGIPVDDSIGFGDSMNDLEMIETVGTGVCMENGSPTLKKLADMICPSVTEDGLFKGFEQLGLLSE